jgi:hypothetical protein
MLDRISKQLAYVYLFMRCMRFDYIYEICDQVYIFMPQRVKFFLINPFDYESLTRLCSNTNMKTQLLWVRYVFRCREILLSQILQHCEVESQLFTLSGDLVHTCAPVIPFLFFLKKSYFRVKKHGKIRM